MAVRIERPTTYYRKYLKIHLRNGQQVEKGCKKFFKPLVWNKTANLKNMQDVQHNLSSFVMGIIKIKCTEETDTVFFSKKEKKKPLTLILKA